MYMDGVVLYGLVIVAATCLILGYMLRFAYRHIKQDIAKNDRK